MRFAYADPPYPGQAKRHYGAEARRAGREAKEVNHQCLIGYLCDEFPDGWALSTSSPALREILPMCPEGARVLAWTKPFAPAYTWPRYSWEPVILVGGRSRRSSAGRDGEGEASPLDWHSGMSARTSPAGTRRGDFFAGKKPRAFCYWLFRCLGALAGDDLEDVFPGTGAVSAYWSEFMGGPLFADLEVGA